MMFSCFRSPRRGAWLPSGIEGGFVARRLVWPGFGFDTVREGLIQLESMIDRIFSSVENEKASAKTAP
jgi:hypothetical protein